MQCSKKTRVLTVPCGTLKTKKLCIGKKIKNDICVEVLAMDEKGTKVIIREIVGDKGIHDTYMNVYNKLMNMGENVKWEVHCVHTRSINSVYYNENREEEV